MKNNKVVLVVSMLSILAISYTTQIEAKLVAKQIEVQQLINANAYIQLARNLKTATTDMQKAQAWKNFRITSASADHLSTNEIIRQAMQLHDNKTLSDDEFTRILGAFDELYRLHKNRKGEWFFDENGTQTKLSSSETK
jgi:hypothetical protein